ncbi:helix-turn-helix protein [Sinobaca qinghaiensis]|uniref:Helix-turn-helix protein n=1 Tax=Sinobaca qinghaiensis TaxID=342944 RepID=A0A419V5U1_9BACL|nr:helix-turn-helix domain-containing protein [Sinobaca qinghaiensis]RKD75319.1 helix-turn-helix protein [Sinobaca qinghaiensis]
MSELGAFLRNKRLDQNMSLDYLQEATKIQKRYLLAIENGQYEALPGAFYAKAFVKSYSEALGLNPDTVIEQYGGELPEVHHPENRRKSRMDRLQRRRKASGKSQGRPTLLPVFAGILFLGIVGFGLFLAIQGLSDSGDQSSSPGDDPGVQVESNEDPGEPPASQENEQEEDAPAEEEEENGSQPEEVSSEGMVTTFDVSGMETLEIELTFTGESYIDTKDESGSIIDQYDGTADMDPVTLDYSDLDYVLLNIGNTSGVELTINGEAFEWPNDSIHQNIVFERME